MHVIQVQGFSTLDTHPFVHSLVMCAIQVLGLAPLITHRLVFTGDVHVTQFQGKFHLRKNTIIFLLLQGVTGLPSLMQYM